MYLGINFYRYVTLIPIDFGLRGMSIDFWLQLKKGQGQLWP